MSKVFKGQKLRLTLNSNVTDFTNCIVRIKYRKPSGTTGEFTPSSTSAPYIIYDTTSATDLGENGVWKFWSFVTWADGQYADGDPIEVEIYNPGL